MGADYPLQALRRSALSSIAAAHASAQQQQLLPQLVVLDSGGDLQPFFAQRNIDPGTTMQRNEFVRPAPDTRADQELAIAIARLERSEGGPAANAHRSVAAKQPAGQAGHMRVPSGGPAGHVRVPSNGQPGHMRVHSNGSTIDPKLRAPPLPASAAKGGYKLHSHAATAPPLQHGYSMLGEAPAKLGPAAGQDEASGGATSLEAIFQRLNSASAGGGLSVSELPMHQQPELWRTGSGQHYDAAITRQMSGVHAVPLTPRVNKTEPALETAEMARKRLEMRLQRYGLCERKIKGDGNCQFRAVADQLYRDSKFHLDVRRIAVHQLRSNQSSYSQFVPTDYWKYCWEMEQPGTWGDHVTLQAIADAFGLRINILTSYPNSAFIGISPTTEKSHRCLYLSFWAEIHYQSLFPRSEPPRPEKFLGSKTLGRLFN